jgi:hypothetical protein
MPEKQKARSWKELQTMIAAGAMMLSFALCNLIASFDRHDDNGDVDDNTISAVVTPTPPPPDAAPGDSQSAALVSTVTPVVTSTGSS